MLKLKHNTILTHFLKQIFDLVKFIIEGVNELFNLRTNSTFQTGKKKINYSTCWMLVTLIKRHVNNVLWLQKDGTSYMARKYMLILRRMFLGLLTVRGDDVCWMAGLLDLICCESIRSKTNIINKLNDIHVKNGPESLRD